MNIFDQQRDIAKRFKSVQIESQKKEPDISIKKPKDHRSQITKHMKTTINNWKRKGVNSYDEFVAYLDNPTHKEVRHILDLWKNELPKNKLMWSIYEEDMELYKEGNRRCSYCEVIKPFESFVVSKGHIKGYKCKECIKDAL